MLISKDKVLDEGIILKKKKCIYEEDFIRAYKETDNQDIKYLINQILDSYLYKIWTVMLDFSSDLATIISEPKKTEPYKLCYIQDHFKLAQRVFDAYMELSYEYDSYKSKEGYWEFIDFDIEDMWKEHHIRHGIQLPSLDEIMESNFVLESLDKYQRSKKDEWINLPAS